MQTNPSSTTIDQFLPALPESARSLVARLHAIALSHQCRYKIEAGEDGRAGRVKYSAMDLAIQVDGENVKLFTRYDFRAFLDFYRNRADEETKALLFGASRACSFCINDKCTTLLADRTIYLGQRKKRLCGVHWYHGMELPVDHTNIDRMEPVIDMAFRYCTAEMHGDLAAENVVTYQVEAFPETWMVGFRHLSTMLSLRTEDFIRECFEQAENGCTKLDVLWALTGQPGDPQVIGVTRDFVDGLCYTFNLGVTCAQDHLPEQLPEGTEAVRLGAGEYALYRSSAGDYKSIWRHFKDKFYEAEKKGYDVTRLPFECFDREGRLIEVGIPVAAGITPEAVMRRRVIKTPDIRIAGFLTYNETDYPLHTDVPAIHQRLHDLFPHAERTIQASTHNKPGQPSAERLGVEIDKLDIVPEGLQEMTLRGGYWHAASFPYPAPGDYVFGTPYRAAFDLDDLNHPRAFLWMEYNGRGAYSEVYIPVRIRGERVIEVVERQECKLIGKEVALPEKVVSEADIEAFYRLPANPRPGSCAFAFRYEMHNELEHFAPPVIKGFEVDGFTDVPAGLETFTLPGGKYVRLSETLPNGELDWGLPYYALRGLEKDTGWQPDLARLFFVHQTGYGREFTLYVPVNQKQE